MPLQVTPLPALQTNYIWILGTQWDPNAVVCVDPGDATPVQHYLETENKTLAGILVTHHHSDHTGGIDELTNLYSVPVYGKRDSQTPHLSHPLEDQAHFSPPGFDISFTVMEIPGHTLDHIAYYGDHKLFCGDTLFAAGCGRLFEGTPSQLYNSLQTLSNLPEDTLIYPAHEYTRTNLEFAKEVEPQNIDIQTRLKTVIALGKEHKPTLPVTLKEEWATNPFLRIHEPEVIASVSMWAGGPLTDPIEIFAALRHWKDKFTFSR